MQLPIKNTQKIEDKMEKKVLMRPMGDMNFIQKKLVLIRLFFILFY